uniref:Uncharacterized protein n=1 Tax=Arundo donax TaxID=35708 RepID=A0A0A9AJE7_ARUDO
MVTLSTVSIAKLN